MPVAAGDDALSADLDGEQRVLARALERIPDGTELHREQHVGSSYLASEDPRLHFGLGNNTEPVSVAIRWPDGVIDVRSDVAVDEILQVP